VVLRCCSYPRCGRVVYQPPGSNRCPEHPKPPKRTGSYTRAAAQLRAAATTCHICGEGPRANDPWVADHLLPRMFGGSDDISNLAAAHQSCNGRRGARLLA
jgi:5-methylcytosine-specific restriction endonuclease McrA